MKRPDLFIVGAPKCGTSALFYYLKQHPQIFMACGKELHFFGTDVRYPKRPTLDQYLLNFAEARDESRVGEASTSYLFSRSAAREIRAFNPSARIVIMLRNPVEMMYSLHSEMLYWLNEDIEDFKTALEAEEQRKQGLLWPRRVHIIDYLFYRNVAHFTEQVRRYMEVFGRDAVRVIVHDDFKADPQHVFGQTLSFLGVDPAFRPPFDQVNLNKRVRNKALQKFVLDPPGPARWLPKRLNEVIFGRIRGLNTAFEPRRPMDIELRHSLQAEFLPEVQALSDLLGRDLTHWCRPAGDR